MTRNEEILSEVQKRFLNDKTHIALKVKTFIDGAEWADEHPKHGTVNKQEFIEKACEILDSMLYMRDCGDYDCVASAYDTVEDFINRFCEAMEE